MKIIFILFLLIPVLSNNIKEPNDQNYTYLLTVISLDDNEQSFDLKITSVNDSNEIMKTNLTGQKPPFEYKLKSGTHTITFVHLGKEGLIKSKITGIVNGRNTGYASSCSRHVEFIAGPKGRYTIKNLKKD